MHGTTFPAIEIKDPAFFVISDKQQKAVCILGMHRSGTSAVTRAVNLLGPSIGRIEHLMPPVKGDNPLGFWENWSIFSFHEKVLSYLSSTWDSILPLPDNWWEEPEIGPFRDELRHLIKSEFEGEDLWMWKDPRTSILLPLWKDVLQELGVDVCYLICVRNPLDVAASLSRRNRFPKRKSLSLWLLYISSALFWTHGSKRLVLHFDDLIADWERSLRKVSVSFGVPWPQDDRELRKSVAEFIQPDGRHSHSETELLLNDKEVAEPVIKTYRLLLEALEDKDILDSERFSKEIEGIYLNYCMYAKMIVPQYDRSARSAGLNVLQKEEKSGVNEKRRNSEISGGAKPAAKPSPGQGFRELVFPAFETCRVSIIIPVWNQWELSHKCLLSILENTDEVPYEVIVVDNASSDATGESLSKSTNLRVVRNRSNIGYLLACNQGAGVARGELILFLNNDTVVTGGWLKAMTAVLDRDGTVGAVGAKLILPDGSLQEAGGIIWADASTASYGRGGDPYDPRFCYVREVDYCSGACLLVRKDIFFNLGGFDVSFSPAYYEDADLCFGMKRLGYRVIYQPGAEIIHHEFGSSSKKDALTLYMKNMPLFARKWKSVLSGQFSPYGENMLLARDSRRLERILVIDWRTTLGASNASFRRAHDFTRFLAEFGYIVTLFSLLPQDDCRSHMGMLQDRGIEVFCKGDMLLEDFMRERSGLYDALIFFAPENSSGYLKLIREMFPSAPVIYDLGESEPASEAAEKESVELLRSHGADVLIASSKVLGDTLAEQGLHNVFAWEYPLCSNAESHTNSQKMVLSGILKDTLRRFSRKEDEHSRAWQSDSFIQELQAKIHEMEKYIRSLEETLPKKDEYISDLLRTMKEKDDYITSLQSELKKKKGRFWP